MSDLDITRTTELDPWFKQSGGGTGALPGINTGIVDELGKPWTSYQGDWISDLNPNQMSALNEIFRYNMEGGGGQNLAERFGDVGTELLGAYDPAQKYFEGVTSGEIMPNQGPDMAQVAMMADNPYMTGMVDAASRDVTRNLQENVLPGMAAYSAGTGNLGSSRRGAAEAIAERGAADRIADIGSQLRGDAYRTGLGLEAQRAGQNAGFRNAGAGALANLGGAGRGLLESRDDLKRQSYADALGASDRYQLQDQLETNALRAQHTEDQTLRTDQLQQLLSMVLPQETAFGKQTTTVPFNSGLAGLAALLGAGGGSGGGAGGAIGDLLGKIPGIGPILQDALGGLGTEVTNQQERATGTTNTTPVDATSIDPGIVDTSQTVDPVTGTTTGGGTNVATGAGQIDPVTGAPITGDVGGGLDLSGGGTTVDLGGGTGTTVGGGGAATGGGVIPGGIPINIGGTQEATTETGDPGSAGTGTQVDDENFQSIEEALANGDINQGEYDQIAGERGQGAQVVKPTTEGEMQAGTGQPGGGDAGMVTVGGELPGETTQGQEAATDATDQQGGGGEVPEGEFTELWGSTYEQGSIDAEGAVFAEQYWAEGLSGDEADDVAAAYSDAYKNAIANGMTKDQAQQAAMLAGAQRAAAIKEGKGEALPPNLAPPAEEQQPDLFGEPLAPMGPPESDYAMSAGPGDIAVNTNVPGEAGYESQPGGGGMFENIDINTLPDFYEQSQHEVDWADAREDAEDYQEQQQGYDPGMAQYAEADISGDAVFDAGDLRRVEKMKLGIPFGQEGRDLASPDWNWEANAPWGPGEGPSAASGSDFAQGGPDWQTQQQLDFINQQQNVIDQMQGPVAPDPAGRIMERDITDMDSREDNMAALEEAFSRMSPGDPYYEEIKELLGGGSRGRLRN